MEALNFITGLGVQVVEFFVDVLPGRVSQNPAYFAVIGFIGLTAFAFIYNALFNLTKKLPVLHFFHGLLRVVTFPLSIVIEVYAFVIWAFVLRGSSSLEFLGVGFWGRTVLIVTGN